MRVVDSCGPILTLHASDSPFAHLPATRHMSVRKVPVFLKYDLYAQEKHAKSKNYYTKEYYFRHFCLNLLANIGIINETKEENAFFLHLRNQERTYHTDINTY